MSQKMCNISEIIEFKYGGTQSYNKGSLRRLYSDTTPSESQVNGNKKGMSQAVRGLGSLSTDLINN